MNEVIADLKDPEDLENRTYRQVNEARKHTVSVGQLVELESGVRLFVTEHTRDCDGTLLYSLSAKETDEKSSLFKYSFYHGYGEENLKVVKESTNE